MRKAYCIQACYLVFLLFLSSILFANGFRPFYSLIELPKSNSYPKEKYTDHPVIGVLTLPLEKSAALTQFSSFLATSYVRWVEAGGAQVVPILYNESEEQMQFILQRVNGILFTGGLVEFNPSEFDAEGSKYLATTKTIFRHVLSENEAGNYFPVWGTCLGFERIIQLLAGQEGEGSELLYEVDAENYAANLDLTIMGWKSRLFSGLSYDLMRKIASQSSRMAFHNHGLGIHPDMLQASNAGKYLKVLSNNVDRHGTVFASTMEGVNLPIYGSQWHPEKAPWEWNPNFHIDHSMEALELSSYLGRFFVNECKYNRNKFAPASLQPLLVANWQSFPSSTFTQVYIPYSEIIFFQGESTIEINR